MKKILLVLLVLVLSTACTAEEKSPFLRRVDYALGTVIEIKLYDKQSEEVMDKLFARLKEIEQRMSFSIESSDIYKLNHAEGKVVSGLHEETVFVLKEAVRFNKISGGFFDPTLGNLIEMWGIGSENARIPSQTEIDQALLTLGTDRIHFLDATTVQMDAGMKIDLGAIAKGYAADEVAKLCVENGVQSAIIDLGGNVLALGDKAGKPFVVGIRDPFSAERSALGILDISNLTLVTSGDYERFFEADGKRYHHILDYRTGYPVESDLASVTIITSKSIEADGYSTSTYAMGLEAGLKFIESQKDLEAIFVTKDKRVIITEGLKNTFKLESNDFTLIQ